MDITKVEDRALVPLGGALVPQSGLTYRIDLVATEAYGSRPFKKFKSDEVMVDAEHGILRFNTRALDVQEFIWQLVFKRKGKGNPKGEFVNVYVDAMHHGYCVATATLKGHISTCNNMGPKHGYVIEVQANSEIEVTYHGSK